MENNEGYVLKLSKHIIPHLGINLYNTIASVISEFISNSYDADAKNVSIDIYHNDNKNTDDIWGCFLSQKDGKDQGYKIVIKDDGHGMTPQEVARTFLIVGRNRRRDEDGDSSRTLKRPVMGSKGIGKLAAFGVCHKMEILSAGGEYSSKEAGYHGSHISLNRDDIFSSDDESYSPNKEAQDGTYLKETGTSITLTNFEYKKMPTKEVFIQQISSRYSLDELKEFNIVLNGENLSETTIKTKTKIDFYKWDDKTTSSEKVNIKDLEKRTAKDNSKNISIDNILSYIEYDNSIYPIAGWVGYSEKPNNPEYISGIRIICRGKLATKTFDFNCAGSYTGQFNVKSYLVGVLYADWLDEKEDLILTNRNEICWSNPLCEKFQEWGQKLIKLIAKKFLPDVEQDNQEKFKELEEVKKRIESEFSYSEELQTKAYKMAGIFGKNIHKSDYENNKEKIQEHIDFAILFAPILSQDDALNSINETSNLSISDLNTLLKKAQIGELTSYGNIAKKRVDAIIKIKNLVTKSTTEQLMQKELEESLKNAPWLLHPAWIPISQNTALKNIVDELNRYFDSNQESQAKGFPKELAGKRPDFVFFHSNNATLEVVEIKKSQSIFKNDDWERTRNYIEAFDSFFQDKTYKYTITLICKEVNITDRDKNDAYNSFLGNKINLLTWNDFINKAIQNYKEFMDEYENRFKKQ